MYDYLIIGQGIAGTILSYTLLNEGKKILVADQGNADSCSAVAAGLFNPVTGKRMVRTWNAGKLFPFLHAFYPQMEKEIGVRFFYPKTIYRPFSSIEEQNHWMSQSDEEGFVKILPEMDQMFKEVVVNPYGGFATSHSGNVHVKKMIAAYKEYLIKKDVFRDVLFSYEDMEVLSDRIRWKDMEFRAVIFCEGYQALKNPFFKWIPFSPSKGEILLVKIKELPADTIINKNLFIVPWEGNIYKVGATFERTIDPGITERGREEIAERLKGLLRVPFEIISQEAGIRPSVPDRRPLVGTHPVHRHVAIFNGLGTKGISLAPYYAAQFVNTLGGKSVLDPEINIQRYYSLYYNQKG